MNNPINILLPDALIMTAIVCAILSDTFSMSSNRQHITYLIAIASSIISGIWFMILSPDAHKYYFFSRMIIIDSLSNVMKSVISFSFAVSLIYSRKYLEDRGLFRSDLFLLGMFSLLGQLIMVSGNNFLTLYLGLELMSIALYALIGLPRDTVQSSESAIKYYVLGALASGFMLYGISMLYAATSSLDLGDVLDALRSGHINVIIALFGTVFIVAGIAFKLGVVPFHMWMPDVYQGAPTAITLLLGGGPKIAAFAWGLRFLVIGLLPLANDWQAMLIILVVLSLFLGNLAGIVQNNIKRMLAYSSISNMGMMLLGLISGVIESDTSLAANAYSSAMFYIITYLITTLGTFGVIMLISRSNFEAESINDFKGLNKRSPAFAFAMMVMMFSLAGIPPTVGFYAKLSVLEATINAGLTWLALLAVITSLFGAFFYLRIVKLIYFDDPSDMKLITGYMTKRTLLLLNSITILVLGLFPNLLLKVCLQAIQNTMPF
ncbi:MAG: NADH-quinone oxidoreductase subunit NuoN [Burkholderia sp.]|nr:NADH-quinone oxidoreductase subunit NuoN [Burkholderia sp.]